jgi:hypothetical protein
MKGKIVYITEVEKEVEIPDEFIKLKNKKWRDLTEEDDERIDELSESIWGDIPLENRCGMYYGHAALEEY